MVGSIGKMIVAGALVWALAPASEAAARPNDGAKGSSPLAILTTHTLVQDTTGTSGTSGSTTKHKHKKSSKRKRNKKSSTSDSTSTSGSSQRRGEQSGSGDMNNPDQSGTGRSDTNSNWPSGTSGGNVQQTDSVYHRGTQRDSSWYNDRNNSSTMDTSMNGMGGTRHRGTSSDSGMNGGGMNNGGMNSDSGMNNRRGGNWNNGSGVDTNMNNGGINNGGNNSGQDSGLYHRGGNMNNPSDTSFNNGSQDSSFRRGGTIDTSGNGGIYHRGTINDSTPGMNNNGTNDSLRMSPPEQRQNTGDSSNMHHQMGLVSRGMVLGSYYVVDQDTGTSSQSGSGSNQSGQSGSSNQSGNDDQSGNSSQSGSSSDQNSSGTTRRGGSMGSSSSDFNGTFKASLMDASTKAQHSEATVRVSVTGVKMVDPSDVGEKAKRGEAHIHYQLDDGPIIATTATRLSFHNLSSGDHTITVMLAGNDHTPLGPEQTLKVTVPSH